MSATLIKRIYDAALARIHSCERAFDAVVLGLEHYEQGWPMQANPLGASIYAEYWNAGWEHGYCIEQRSDQGQ
jgi:hypothetical protein